MTRELAKRDERFAQIMSQAKRLDRFYITARYPNGIPGGSPFQVYDRDDLAGACEDLRGVFTLCRNFLEERGMSQSK